MLWLSQKADRFEEQSITRFDPRFWTVNFPRPMMAAVTNPGGEALDVSLVFYQRNDLAGLIWESEDLFDHPLLSYETRRDYRHVILTFRWQSVGIKTLADGFGPTLTIEGRDATGTPRTWFVRLWNYASGTASNAVITLDFNNLDGGFFLPAEADPVYAGDIDRMFISMVPDDYDPEDDSPLTGGAVEGRVSMSDIRVTGGNADLAIGDDYVKPHTIRMANGYDDSFNITPARLMRNVLQLGYRAWFTHYVGMSHYYTMAWDAQALRWVVDPAAPALNAATLAWHTDLFSRLARFRMTLVLSLSFEILDQNAPDAWAQRAHDGSRALTGWEPPSTLIAPTNGEALGWLERVFSAFGDLMDAAGLPLVFQIGEPWWWVSLGEGRIPHFYDPQTLAAYPLETGHPVPEKHQSATEIPSAEQQLFLDWLGEKLGAATHRLRDHVKGRYPGAHVALLFFTPQVLDDSAPMLRSVNFPVSHWASPAYDLMQIEDYDHVIDGNWADHARGVDSVVSELGYPLEKTQFFSGFVLLEEDRHIWRNIEFALEDAERRGFSERVIWAYTQVVRDGVVMFDLDQKEQDLAGFHDVRLPDTVSFGSTGGPRFSTRVVATASGHERRNRDWDQARADYDISSGLRSVDDLAQLMAFFRARAGRAYGFRFRDWADHRSSLDRSPPAPTDQEIGVGDGSNQEFQLIKRYGDGDMAHIRRITRPVDGSVRIALDGVERTTGWSVDPHSGLVRFDVAPLDGAVVSAGFLFDVPVRFADDALSLSLEAFDTGAAPAIRLLEIKE
ncbi:hypothetical protein JCM17844_07110 [Iodidimonas gelatinilytica]|uniref:TIGR02217 family protein n=1 Tax=Iodidimonas gelatinilytica TaxID=1236966 RepID=A0A5A7MN59_9PROT|nr:DUF2460 domain-containing protein [Iodidimonas gelatinilytica]GEQ97074.1 hypothetical protein JCM17844_07110 [Iodidimonas gelatinilytica]GEQ99408.1 hypothetical protein JCM17845_00320 [Iodidimonas gelatinilytica]